MSNPSLWPDPVAMHGYLDRWAQHVTDVDERLTREIHDRKVDEARAENEINQLKNQLATQTGPLEKQILDYQRQVRDLQVAVTNLETERNTAISRLAHLIEVSPTAKGLTLLTLINDVNLFVEEAKQQFRASL